MEDKSVTEIMINSHDEIFVEREGQLSRLPITFESRARLEDLIPAVVAGLIGS